METGTIPTTEEKSLELEPDHRGANKRKTGKQKSTKRKKKKKSQKEENRVFSIKICQKSQRCQ